MQTQLQRSRNRSSMGIEGKTPSTRKSCLLLATRLCNVFEHVALMDSIRTHSLCFQVRRLHDGICLPRKWIRVPIDLKSALGTE